MCLHEKLPTCSIHLVTCLGLTFRQLKGEGLSADSKCSQPRYSEQAKRASLLWYKLVINDVYIQSATLPIEQIEKIVFKVAFQISNVSRHVLCFKVFYENEYLSDAKKS